jgi:pyrroline-5-carboxylate reductase
MEVDLIINKEIAFIGPGVMAEAMIAGLIRQTVAPPDKITASGPRIERVEELASLYGINPETDNAKAVNSAELIILSVKPQRLDAVLNGIQGAVPKDSWVLSIVAGASIAKISGILEIDSVVRAMPNTPAQIGEGITVWTAAPSVSTEQKEMAQHILAALGQEIFLEEETYLNMATALSGTGPAYVFLFMEAMVDAGVHLGFPRRVAEQLVAQTVRGSVDYYTRDTDPVHLARLRNQVTSPGGTSAAALYYLEKAGFRTAISRAVWAAYERSRELGRDARAHWPEKVSGGDDE